MSSCMRSHSSTGAQKRKNNTILHTLQEKGFRAPGVNSSDIAFLRGHTLPTKELTGIIRSTWKVPKGQITPGDLLAIEVTRNAYEGELLRRGIKVTNEIQENLMRGKPAVSDQAWQASLVTRLAFLERIFFARHHRQMRTTRRSTIYENVILARYNL